MTMNNLQGRHVLITANTSWCLAHFRGTVIDTLLAQGCRVTILTPKDTFSDDLAARGCEFIDIKMDRHGLSPVSDYTLMRRFKAQFKASKPDVIIGYTIKNNIYGAIAARAFEIPFIAVIPGLGNAFSSDNWLQKLAIGLYRFAFRDIHMALFSNVENSNVFADKGMLDAERGVVLDGEGVNITTFAEQPMAAPSPRVFLFCARLLHSKGIGEFVEAARIIRKRDANTEFHILGKLAESHPEGVSQDQMDQWIAQGNVKFMGATNDVRRFIAAAHCVVLPSYYQEGMPRILLDANATGRLVITTDTAGCRETVVDSETGFLCPARDVSGLVDCMQKVVEMDQSDLEQMGRNARKLAQTRFDDRITAAVYVGLLEALFERSDAA
jgi:glycosyltransferase involved in cell wall biosynthesis